MPLLKGKANIGKNIHEMEASGHKHSQAVAAALHAAYGRPHTAGGFVGSLTGATPGRADDLPIDVPNGSHVIPADVVSALGSGNSSAGHRRLHRMFPKSLGPRRRPPHPHSPMAKGGKATVPIMASDGEFIISPEDIARIGDGNSEVGHRHLDKFILHVRKANIKSLKKLPGPVK